MFNNAMYSFGTVDNYYCRPSKQKSDRKHHCMYTVESSTKEFNTTTTLIKRRIEQKEFLFC